MNIQECMSRDVRIANPDQSIREAAAIMREIDAGALPVGKDDRLVGMITDRDIAVRAVAEGKGPDTKVDEIMTHEVEYCFDDEDVTDVAIQMSDLQVRRLPVLNREKRLVGIIALADIAQSDDDAASPSGIALAGVTEPGGQHVQTSGTA